MWSWHWSPLTQTSLLLSPSNRLASFLETTLANGVMVVEKVITSKFRFHLIAIYTLGCFRNFSCTPVTVPKLPWRAPTPVRLVKEWILMLLIKKQLTWKLFIYWYLMSFFHKKMSQNVWATIMPFGPVTLNFLRVQDVSAIVPVRPHFIKTFRPWFYLCCFMCYL